jgi:monoamine oxidase
VVSAQGVAEAAQVLDQQSGLLPSTSSSTSSYLKTGQYTAFNGIQGRRSGNLHFAGEHTSVNFQGYMEGALRSGYRCAVEIAGRTPA